MKFLNLIHTRVLALVLIFAAVFFLLVQYQYETNIKDLLQETEQTTFNTLSDTMASIFSLNLAFDLKEENRLVIDDYLAKSPQLRAVMLFDRSGNVLFNRGKVDEGVSTERVIKELEDPQNGSIIGRAEFVYVSGAVQKVEEEDSMFAWRFFSVSSAVLVLLIWMLNRVFGPLDRMVDWIEAFDPKKGILEKLPPTKSAEVQTIQNAMFDMMERIGHYTSELDEYSSLLDAKVRMRTEALTRTNALLNKEIAQRKATEEALKAANERLTELSRIDTLTGIANRRFFQEVLQDRWMLSIREQKYISLVICDIDHFKTVNDRYGHMAGDVVIKEVARVLKLEIKRASDLVARYGGEEFAFILFDTDKKSAEELIRKIQDAFAMLPAFPSPAEAVKGVTLSYGICTLLPQPGQNASNCMAAADKAMYRAKETGRNRVVSFDTI